MKNLLVATTFAVSLLAGTSFAQTPTKTPSQTDASAEAKRPGDPIPGVGVNLAQEDGTIVKATKTTATGQFEFKDVKPGRYLLKIEDGEKGTETSRINTSRSNIKTQAARPTTSETADDSATPQTKAGISTSRSNLRSKAPSVMNDPAKEENIASDTAQSKAGVSTSRSNVRTKTAASGNLSEEEEVIVVQLASAPTPDTKRTHVVPHVLEQKGLAVDVPADGRLTGTLLKTRHDTVKNSINNVR